MLTSVRNSRTVSADYGRVLIVSMFKNVVRIPLRERHYRYRFTGRLQPDAMVDRLAEGTRHILPFSHASDPG
jgi:hypothetical protein